MQSRTTRVRVWDPACADHEPDPGTPLEWGQTESTRAMPPHTPSRHRRPNNLSSSSIQQRVSHVRKLISAPDEPYTRARWRSWFDNSMLLTLDSNFQEVQRDIGSIHSLLSRHKLTNELRHWKRVRRSFQRSLLLHSTKSRHLTHIFASGRSYADGNYMCPHIQSTTTYR